MTTIARPRKQPRQARSQAMVEAILDAAARVLTEQGYARLTTNLVAERAGVSIGSLYQYFPNKESLVSALHARHVGQMHEVIASVLAHARPRSLRGAIKSLVRAELAAHLLEPQLHRVLERELPFFDANDSEADAGIRASLRELVEAYRDEIVPRNLDLAAWTVGQLLPTLVHAAVIEPPEHASAAEVEGAVVDALMGYLAPGA